MSEQRQPGSYDPLGAPLEPPPVQPMPAQQLPPQAVPPQGAVGSAPQAPPGPEGEPAGADVKQDLHRTRWSAWYTGLVVAAVLLILLLIFIVQNSRSVSIHYLGFHGRISLAIALILSAVVGILLVAVPGGARILQLRRVIKRNAKDGR